jgi:O-antigen/teichoic acid export membrane protein
VPITSLFFLLPVFAVMIRPTLPAATAAAAAAHVIGWVAWLAACIRAVPALRAPARPQRDHLRELIRYGGWLSVSNVIAPFMLYLDRFLIARMVSAAGVAYYTTPFGAVTQLWLVPRAIIEALFPRLVADFVRGGSHARATYRRGLLYVLGLLIPAALLVIVVARPALALWIDPEFAARSYRVAQVLAVGVLINAVGLVATAVIQAAGRPDITARLHMLEAPLYFTYLVVLLGAYGITGAAFAWLVRVSISAIALSVIAERCLSNHTRIGTAPGMPDISPASAAGGVLA